MAKTIRHSQSTNKKNDSMQSTYSASNHSFFLLPESQSQPSHIMR